MEVKMFKSYLKLIAATAVLVCLCAAQSAMAQKKIAFICNSGSVRYATHDARFKAILGTAGTTIGGTNIPGLNYQVIEYQQGLEPNPITAAIADLIIVSETIDSGTPLYHTDDPVPIVMTEQALYDNDAPPRSEMYFSEGAGNTATDTVFDFNITNNTHPITAIFPLGNMRVFNAGQLGNMVPPIASAVTVLAYNPATPANPCLAVAEAGATGFLPGGTGNNPAPARRVCIGYHENAMSDPTVNGVYLMQRTVQWAIGDPVTAGGAPPTPPAAPSGLTAQATGMDKILLSWVDNSNNESGFKLERKTSTTAYVEIAQPGQNATAYVDTGLTPGMVYFYQIRATNSAGNSAYSNEASAMTGALAVRRWQLY
jgi:hypothetical protein